MFDQDTKKLSRAELLEMLISISNENDTLKTRIAQLEYDINTKAAIMNSTGSIETAAYQLNSTVISLNTATDRYLYALQTAQNMLSNAEARAAQIEEAARKTAENIIAEAEAAAARLRGGY